jgi:WAS/WASL-interacting protein
VNAVVIGRSITNPRDRRPMRVAVVGSAAVGRGLPVPAAAMNPQNLGTGPTAVAARPTVATDRAPARAATAPTVLTPAPPAPSAAAPPAPPRRNATRQTPRQHTPPQRRPQAAQQQRRQPAQPQRPPSSTTPRS